MLHYGRRKAIALDSFFYVVGPVCMAFASHASILLIGRFLVGVGIGMSAVVAPAYLGEIAPAHLRGRIVESYEILLCFGMLASVAMDVAFGHLPHNWRWMVRLSLDHCIANNSQSSCLLAFSSGCGCDHVKYCVHLARSARQVSWAWSWLVRTHLSSFVAHACTCLCLQMSSCAAVWVPNECCCLRYTAGLYVLPESPRWLVVSGRLDEALAVIHKIYLSVGLQNGEQNAQCSCQRTRNYFHEGENVSHRPAQGTRIVCHSDYLFSVSFVAGCSVDAHGPWMSQMSPVSCKVS